MYKFVSIIHPILQYLSRSLKKDRNHHYHHDPSPYTSYCWTWASSQNEKARPTVPTRTQYSLKTSQTPLNCFADSVHLSSRCFPTRYSSWPISNVISNRNLGPRGVKRGLNQRPVLDRPYVNPLAHDADVEEVKSTFYFVLGPSKQYHLLTATIHVI